FFYLFCLIPSTSRYFYTLFLHDALPISEYRELCRRALFTRLRRRGVRGACARHGARPADWARSRQDLLDADGYLGDCPRRRANRRRPVGRANCLAWNLLGTDWPARRAATAGPKNRSRNR